MFFDPYAFRRLVLSRLAAVLGVIALFVALVFLFGCGPGMPPQVISSPDAASPPDAAEPPMASVPAKPCKCSGELIGLSEVVRYSACSGGGAVCSTMTTRRPGHDALVLNVTLADSGTLNLTTTLTAATPSGVEFHLTPDINFSMTAHPAFDGGEGRNCRLGGLIGRRAPWIGTARVTWTDIQPGAEVTFEVNAPMTCDDQRWREVHYSGKAVL